MTRAILLALVVLVGLLPAGGQAQSAAWPEPRFTAYASALSDPVTVTHAGDGSGRLFVVERVGRIRTVANGAVTGTFLDIVDRVRSTGSEQGLLGLAFPPGYASKGYYYAYYTRRSDGANTLSRFTNAGSEEVLFAIADPFANHNGGQLAFGSDGYLYVGLGDGGSGGDPGNRAQNPAELLGKLLRLDVESGARPYGIPPGNPQASGWRPEIWALGLRNPWRFSFDRQTGDLYLADVGQNAREEINFQAAGSAGGANYGWRIMEGTACFNPSSGCSTAGLTLPVAEYTHDLGCSVTGGYVYRGTSYPRMQGVYFYGDFCTGRVWGLRREGAGWASAQLVDTAHSISTWGEDEAGNLYLADYDGTIYLVSDTVSVTLTRRGLLPVVARGRGLD